MDRIDALEREIAALRARGAELNAAILRIGSSLDLDTVLRETVDSARALTGARYGMIATLDGAGAIEEFIAPGLTPEERREMAAWAHGHAFFEHLRDLPEPLRVANMVVETLTCMYRLAKGGTLVPDVLTAPAPPRGGVLR